MAEVLNTSIIIEYPWYYDTLFIGAVWLMQVALAALIFINVRYLSLRVVTAFMVFIPLYALGFTTMWQFLALSILFGALFARDMKLSKVSN